MGQTDSRIVLRQLGAKIAYYRTLVGLNQTELARKVNSTQSTISKIESGAECTTLSIPMLITIADALNVDLALLLQFNDYEKQMWNEPIVCQ